MGGERGARATARRGKGGTHCEERQIPRKKGKASQKSFPRRGRRKHEQTQKLFRTVDPQSPSPTPSLAKPEIGKEAGRRRAFPKINESGRPAEEAKNPQREEEGQGRTRGSWQQCDQQRPEKETIQVKRKLKGAEEKIYTEERGLVEGPTRKQRHSARPQDAGRTSPQRRHMVRKGKSAVKGDPKKS